MPFVLRRALGPDHQDRPWRYLVVHTAPGDFVVTPKRRDVLWWGALSDAVVFRTEQDATAFMQRHDTTAPYGTVEVLDLAALLLENEAFPLLVVRCS